jgi:predicted nucleic-acid-binding protein
MTGLDTNVLVRYITQDDAKQSPLATQLIESLTQTEPGFVTLVCVVELVWVLTGCYNFTRLQISQALETLLSAKELVVDQADHVAKAVRVYRAGSADFADCLIERIGASAGCKKTMTFDVAAAKAVGMTLIE